MAKEYRVNMFGSPIRSDVTSKYGRTECILVVTAKVNITKVIENVETDNVEKNHRKNPSPIILDLAR